jgi:hypothetical protein
MDENVDFSSAYHLYVALPTTEPTIHGVFSKTVCMFSYRNIRGSSNASPVPLRRFPLRET